MVLVSSFYDGPVTESERAKNRTGSPDYGVYGKDDFKVMVNGSVPLSVKVKAGRAHGWGVTDTALEDSTLTFDAPASGVTRWDLVAVRRDWQPIPGGLSELVVIKGGAFTDIPAGRLVGPGVKDDQPIAMVGWRGGQTAPFQIIDLRCWAHNGGVEIANEIAFEYLERPGAAVHYAGWTWRYSLEGNGVWGWNMAADASQSGSGLMSAADKKKLDDSTAIDTANTLIRRDGNGRARIKNPAGSMDITNKGSVDALIASARSYAASQASSALSSAKSDASSKVNAAESRSKTDASTKSNNALTSAKSYAAGLVTNMRRAASGKRAIGAISAGGSAVNQTVSFPAGRFSSPPNVSVTGGSSRHSIGIQAVTTTGFTFTCSNWSPAVANAGDIYWVAVQN